MSRGFIQPPGVSNRFSIVLEKAIKTKMIPNSNEWRIIVQYISYSVPQALYCKKKTFEQNNLASGFF